MYSSWLISGLVVLLSGQCLCKRTCWDDNKRHHVIKHMHGSLLRNQACHTGGKYIWKHLDVLLKPRVPDTHGGRAAARYIIDYLKSVGWTVEKMTSVQDTIIGRKTFHNIVATFHPESPRRLVLAAHYDTKISPEGFIGAVDSAVPCAMMLEMARKTQTLRWRSKKKIPEITLQLIFFDGEEAFIDWTETDSLYGSRDLADRWGRQSYEVDPRLGFCQSKPATYLDRIEAFVLLDLIGAKKPMFLKFGNYSSHLFDAMAHVEHSLRKHAKERCRVEKVMNSTSVPGVVEDDHIPFFKRGMRNILHMIATPFPSVWHKLEDNGDNLDGPTIEYITSLIKWFVYQYLAY